MDHRHARRRLLVLLRLALALVRRRRLADEWEWNGVVFTFYYPLALWIVVGFFAVARFLGYLDLRMRREGWEVELMMRAEAARLERQLT